MAVRKCPFDGSEMLALNSRQGAESLLDLLISSRSTMYAMLRGSIEGNPHAEFNACQSCGFFAIFTPQLTYQPRVR